MTHRAGTAVRWFALAERRLEYLTELFETGRWRRFHSELAFVENIREAKAAVEIWRDLSAREISGDNTPVGISRLGRGEEALQRGEKPRGQLHRLLPQLVHISVEPPPLMAAEMDQVVTKRLQRRPWKTPRS
jgi:uncharacterized repeat protein (TIGR03809 family)